MKRPDLQSKSGLRPASAYFMIGVVLAVVCGRSWILSVEETHAQPSNTERVEVLPAPDFDIADRDGRALALSVQSMGLALSPRSMWQAHTPRLMAEEIVPHLAAGTTVPQLLRKFFPQAVNGVIHVEAEGWTFDFEQSRRLSTWADELGINDHLWLDRLPGRAAWVLSWRPVELLSAEVRERVAGEKASPLRWTRSLADGLAQAIEPSTAKDRRAMTWTLKEQLRARIWKAMLPCADTLAIKELPPGSVLALIDVLDSQGVAKHQMAIRFENKRVYPMRDSANTRAAFDLMGRWLYLDEEQARGLAALEGMEGVDLRRRTKRLLDIKHPSSGLEGMASKLLAETRFNFIQSQPASYRYRKLVAIHQPSRRYFDEDQAEDQTPRVVSTLDGELQDFFCGQLQATLLHHRAALVMGIVVDVQSGDVLAVGGTSHDEVAEFLPTWHLFSPGSTFKVIVMATALEANAVAIDDQFDTHNGAYRVPGSIRVIHEARGAPTGTISASTALSRSVNAVMVQIGMKVPDEFFHGRLLALGYNSVLGAGVGRESRGSIPKLPWNGPYTHASVSFGHQLGVTLWQHAGAMVTVLRGGVRRPLRLFSEVQLGDDQFVLPIEDVERVYRTDVSRTVRTMMAIGAQTGTGRHISKREREAGTPIELLSKTGTTEKEGGVVCLHLELERNALNSKLPLGRKDPNFIHFNSLKGRPPVHKGSCYTSSICLVGRVPGEQRELMVLIVVEEPRVKLKFGSDVAGPAAIAILKEGLGITRAGISLVEQTGIVPDYGYQEAALPEDQPWRLREGEVTNGIEWEANR